MRDRESTREARRSKVKQHAQVEFTVHTSETSILEGEELDFPEIEEADGERVRLRQSAPATRATLNQDLGRAVQLNGLVRICGRVVDNEHTDQIDARRVVHRCRGG
jgi:hypothetical protein